MTSSAGRVVSVNVGQPARIVHEGREAVSAIGKKPVPGRVSAAGVHLEGDEQADRNVHGGVHKAVYAYAIEDYRFWEGELERDLDPGQFGENLTVSGVDVNAARVGERWAIGTAVFEVSEPRVPCGKLAIRMGDPTFPKAFTRAARPGTYLRIVQEGEIGAGDEVRIASRPEHELTIKRFFGIFVTQGDELSELIETPGVSPAWVEWARERQSK